MKINKKTSLLFLLILLTLISSLIAPSQAKLRLTRITEYNFFAVTTVIPKWKCTEFDGVLSVQSQYYECTTWPLFGDAIHINTKIYCTNNKTYNMHEDDWTQIYAPDPSDDVEIWALYSVFANDGEIKTVYYVN